MKMKSIKTFQLLNKLEPTGEFNDETLLKIKDIFQLDDIELTHFLAQLHHESGGFKHTVENLNYSWKALRRVFGKYFRTDDQAKDFQRKPKSIANKVYANRMGNGNEQSGDGWKFRGRSYIQLTGFNNYKKFSKYLNNPEILKNPDIVSNKYNWSAAIWFFKVNNIFLLCEDVEDSTIKKITKKINGGYNGLKHRTELTHYYNTLIQNIKQNEDFSENINIVSSDNRNIIVHSKSKKESTNIQIQKPIQKRAVKKRFFAKTIKWVLQKISGRYLG